MEKKKNKKYLQLLIKAAVTLICFYYVFNKVDLLLLSETIAKINVLPLIISILLFLVSKIIAAFRLKVFFENGEIQISHLYNLKLYLLGMFYNLFLPSGIGGDAYKVYKLVKKEKTDLKKAASAIFVDRGNGLLIILFLTLIVASLVDIPETKYDLAAYQKYLPLLIPVGWACYYLIVQKIIDKNLNKRFFLTNGYSFLTQLVLLACGYFIMLSLGVEDHIMEYFLISLVASIVIILPFTIGGLGLREMVFVYGAELFGLNQSTAMLVSFTFYLVALLVSLFGVYYSINDEALEDPHEVV